MKKLDNVKRYIFLKFGSQRKASLKTQIPEIRLSHIINGRAAPTAEERKALAWVLGVDEAVLFDECEQPTCEVAK